MKYAIATIMALVILMSTSYAYAENFTVAVDNNGFSQSSLTIGQADSVTFTTTVNAPYSVAITDVLLQIENGLIGHHAFDSEHPITWTFDTCMTHVFEDQYNQFSPMTLNVDCSYQSTAPVYSGTYTVLSLQQELAEVTSDLNLAIEEAGILSNSVNSLTAQLATAESDLVTSQAQVSTLEQELIDATNTLNVSTESNSEQVQQLISEKEALIVERDGWKQLSDNWYGVALEQVRVMVEVLGL
jgi:hypothetical protein